jgi:hypothetical protein
VRDTALSDARQQKACSNKRADGSNKENRRTLK